MTQLGTISYSLSLLAFLVLGVLLVTRYRRKSNRMFGVAIVASLFWSATAAYNAKNYLQVFDSIPLEMLEVIRDISWLLVLQSLLFVGSKGNRVHRVLNRLFLAFNVYYGIIFLALLIVVSQPGWFMVESVNAYRAINHLLLAVIGIFLIEQTLRHVDPDQRWSVKYLCFSLGGLFTYEFYMSADALLLNQFDPDIWVARGFINAFIVPFLVVFILRNTDTTLRFFISHKIAFHTTALLAGGLYLLAMGMGGYYIKLYGGAWGGMLQLVFLFGASIILATLFFSGSMRSAVKVFLGKHFFKYRYDYREEWLRLTESLSSLQESEQLQMNSMLAIANIVDSPAGMLWILRDADRYYPVVNITRLDVEPAPLNKDSPMIEYLQHTQWIVDMDEFKQLPDKYENLTLPDWLKQIPEVWLVVPLIHQSKLSGFVILTHARVKYSLNWEVRDILRTAGRQVAGYLALLEVNIALASARQFEAFNRLAAFVVHDLKNIVAQLSLIGRNAVAHKNNPEFIDDALVTIENATHKMNRLLSQLRIQSSEKIHSSSISLSNVIKEAIKHRSMSRPVPEFDKPEEDLFVFTDKDRLTSVIEHLVQNAQEATKKDGFVRIALYAENNQAKLEIIDNGCGMESDFIRDKLYRPFTTTKGNAGMGIGVYEAREFLRSFGGSIDVQSKVGKGTTFVLSMPINFDMKREVITEAS